MRVLFLTAWYPSKYNPVAGIFVREHAKAVSLFNEVVVLYVQAAQEKQDKLFAVEDCVEEGVRTVRVYYRRLAFLPLLPKILYFLAIFYGWQYIRRRGFLPDIIHGHICTVGIPAILLGRRLKKPVVFTEHSTGFPLHNLPWYDIFSAKYAYPRADLVCPVSEYLAGHIASYGIKANFKVVPNAVDIGLFHPRKIENENNKRGGTGKILTVASLVPKKGVPFLLEALAKVKESRDDFTLDVIGDGPCRKEYENMSVEMGLSEHVVWHGARPKSYVGKLMSECDFFVLPSLCETFGVVLIEALAKGKPVIATCSGGPEEIVSDEVGLLVSSEDASALAKAILQMLDGGYVNYSPEKLFSYVKDRYSCQAVGKMFDCVYKEATERK